MTTIRHKRGVGIPEADDLEVGEIAIDTSTGTAYTKADDGSVVPLGGDDLVITKGDYSIQVGTIDVDDDYSTAVGMKALTGGYAFGGSTSVGMDAKGSKRSVVVGQMAEARTSATAIGISARAWGDYSCSFGGGSFTDADHEYSVAIGASTKTEEPRQVMFGTAPDAPYGKPLNLKTYGTMQASDFLDADGNSIIGGEVDGLINDEASESIFAGALHPDSPNRGNYLVSLGHKNKVDRTGSIAVGWGAEARGDNGCMAVGIESKANHLGATAVGPYATVTNYSGIALGIGAATTKDFEFVISPDIQTVNFSGATVQAKDYLDADGNSIIGAGGDLPDNLVTYNAVLENPETGWYIHSTDLGASSDQAQGFTEITVGTTPQKSAVSLTSGDGPRGEFAALTLSNNESESWPFELKVFGGFNSGEANIWGRANEWIIDAAKITLGDPKGGAREVTVNGTIQANDFLDADGNSIVGGGDVDLDWVYNYADNLVLGFNIPDNGLHANQVLLGNGVKGRIEAVAIGYRADSGSAAVAIGYQAKAGSRAIAIGEDATAGDKEFAISAQIQTVNFSNATVQAKAYLDANGNPATVSPSTMVDAFTTLQTAIADETTIEGIKTALTNSLGGLIERFEGMK